MKAAIDGAGKVEIRPNVQFVDDGPVNVYCDRTVLPAKSSHANLEYMLKVNGQEVAFDPDGIDAETGDFDIQLTDLVDEANFVQLYYKQPDNPDNEGFVLADEVLINKKAGYGVWWMIGGLILSSGLIVLGYLKRKPIKKYFQKLFPYTLEIKKRPQPAVKHTNKVKKPTVKKKK